MASSDDFQALEKISTEVDNSQVSILLSSHCIKAQAFLLDKLRKQAERQKEICKFIGSNNSTLEMEIKLAEQEVKCINITIESVKLGNIELNKEYLLCKERKSEILERTAIGKKKYENLWSTSKKRYETIPIVQKLIEIKNKNQTVRANINAFINESNHLVNQILVKKSNYEAGGRARIIELAHFLIRERPQMLIKLNENRVMINELLSALESLQNGECKNIMRNDPPIPSDSKQAVDPIQDSSLDEDNWSNFNKNTEKDTLLLPKLHLQNKDFDILSVKLDQIKKVDLQITTSMTRTASSISLCLENNSHNINKDEDKINENYTSSYFADNNDKKMDKTNYSDKKLIRIVEDIKLNNKDTYRIMNKLEPAYFHATSYISSKVLHKYDKICTTEDKKNKSFEIEEIVDVDLQKKRGEDVVDPPTQFLDISQVTSQEKKSVSFNLTNKKENPILLEQDTVNPGGIDESQEKLLNNSTISIESYSTIKDKILKTRNLDLSPQFVYSKSIIKQKQHEDKVTSSFFKSEIEVSHHNDMNIDDGNKNIKQNPILQSDDNKTDISQNEVYSLEINNVTVSSPKGDFKELEAPVAGLLFNHGPLGIPDSLNLSISTTGFEENEEFHHGIDSSVLMSPKADIPGEVESSNNQQTLMQEVPNFLAGFRRTGLSFFDNAHSSNIKSDSGAQSQSNSFHFAFDNDDKKGRGGFFSMFK